MIAANTTKIIIEAVICWDDSEQPDAWVAWCRECHDGRVGDSEIMGIIDGAISRNVWLHEAVKEAIQLLHLPFAYEDFRVTDGELKPGDSAAKAIWRHTDYMHLLE